MKYKSCFAYLLLSVALTSTACMAEAEQNQQPEQCQAWPAWHAFNKNLITKDGRVIDPSTDFLYTTSEGQSYGLFFALVANNQPLFNKLLIWTQNNLSQGDLTARLPAWQWGKRKDDSWGVIDSNSASDSDLWITYALLEAGRLFKDKRYTALGKLLSQRILREETTDLPGLGPTLLPGPVGFHPDEKTWRLNPSYVPIQVLRALYHHTHNHKWLTLIQSSQQLLIQSAAKGFAPDWINYHAQNGFELKGEGSFDAIRVYLWAGMMHKDDPLQQAQLNQFKPMLDYLAKHAVPPQSIDIISGKNKGVGSVGFSAALLPFLASSNAAAQLEQQKLRLVARPLSENPNDYYDQVLGLFGQGWIDKRFSFDKEGRLLPAAGTVCP
ncbi:MAG: cellulase [Algicola sp.]|nr:cellulase [Algicola sp.]